MSVAVKPEGNIRDEFLSLYRGKKLCTFLSLLLALIL